MNKSQYFNILKQLHDICRNQPQPTLTGMDAYNEIMNYLYLRHLSDNSEDLDEKYNLRTIYENYCTNDKIEIDLYNMELNKNYSLSGIRKPLYFEKLSEILLPNMVNRKKNKHIAFVKIMKDNLDHFKLDIGKLTNLVNSEDGDYTDGGQKTQKIINKIYQEGFLPTDENGKFNIHMFPYDAVGEGFEKFMSDAGSTGGNWGQYFTKPQVIDWIINRCGVDKNHKIIDPFSGSGGFLLQAKKMFNINANNIYGHENDDRMYKFLKFNGSIADLNLDNLNKGDTYDYLHFIKKHQGKYDRIFTNPPFGLSIDILLSSEDKQNYWNILKSNKKYTIKDSMGLGIYVLFSLLKDDGIAGFVSERGILNNGSEGNSWQRKLRKFLLENANIKEILLLPKGIFSHTNFDTAVIIMEKGKPTEKIVFHQGYFKEEDKGKGDKQMYVKENILTITLKDIVNNNWSLNYDNYIEKTEDLYDGIQYIFIKDNFNILKSKRKANDNTENGKYIFFTSSDKVKFSDYDDFNGEYIVIGDGGLGSCHYINSKFSCSGHNFILENNNKIKLNTKYVFYYIKTNIKLLRELFKGNGLKNLSKTNMENFKIPILPQDHQDRIIENMDKIIGDNYGLLDKLVSKFKNLDLFNILLNENYSNFEKLIDLYNEIVWMEKYINKMKTEFKNFTIKAIFNKYKSKEMKLGEVIKINRGKSLPKNKIIQGEYPVISGSKNILNYNINYNYTSNNTIFMARVGSAGEVLILKGKVYLTDLAFALEPNKKINYMYLYYYLNIMEDYIKKYRKSNAAPNINASILYNIKIQVPSLEDQEKIVKEIDEVNKDDSEYNKSIIFMEKELQKLYDFVELLVNEGKMEIINDNNYEDDEDLEDQDEEQEYEEIEYKGKTLILDGENLYKKIEDKVKNKIYGKFIDGKVIKNKN